MMSLASIGVHRRCAVSALILKQKQGRRVKTIVSRAQDSNAFDSSRLSDTRAGTYPGMPGMYYDSNPPQATPQAANPQPAYYPASKMSYSAAGYEQQFPSPQQSNGYGPRMAAAAGNAVAGMPRINPGRTHINSVRLIGTITDPQRQGRCALAVIQVPYATKEGIQEFLLEAWELEAEYLLGLHGAQVLIDGRLSRDVTSGGVKVVANRIQLVDTSLPSTPYRSGEAGGLAAGGFQAPGASRPARTALDPEQAWRMHYSTSTRTLQALSTHFGVKPDTVSKAILAYAFKSKSPMHWRALAEEAGLGPQDEWQLSDFIEVVSRYKADLAAMYRDTKPGAEPPPLPATADGMLKVKPIREWALGKPADDTCRYTVKQYEAKHGLTKLYDALRMAVVAEETQGVWSYAAEFGSP